MKKVISILCVTLLSFALFFSSSINSSSKDVDLASLITLNTANAEDGGSINCRCHSDGLCYGGNQISFRTKCAEISGGSLCEYYYSNCP